MNLISRTTAIALLLLAAAFLSPLSAQATEYFIYAPGDTDNFPGSTQDDTYKPLKAQELLSFAFGVENSIDIGSAGSGGSAGKATFRSVEIQFVGDLAMLPKLIEKSTTGTHYADLVIEGVTGGIKFMTLELKLCFVENIDLVGTQGDQAVYSVSIPFGAMRLTNFTLNPNGSTTEGTPVMWSVVKNSPEFSVE